MIDGINPKLGVQNVQAIRPYTSPINKPSYVSPIDNYTMAGLESLGIYNMSLVKDKDKFEHKPAELILPMDTKMDEIDGEKVCHPNGDLEYIVASDGKYETRYYPDEKNPDKVDEVEIKDLHTGKLLKKQVYLSNDYVRVYEYPEDESNVSYITYYVDNEMDSVEKEETLPNGSVKSYRKYYGAPATERSISLASKDNKNTIDISFDENNTVNDIFVENNNKNVRVWKDIILNKGAVIRVDEGKDSVIPNFMERDVLNDSDVMPTDKFDRVEIETIAKNSPSDIYSFYGNGHLKELRDKNIVIEFNEDGSQKITEYLAGNITKVTNHDQDGAIDVKYKKGDIVKKLYISSNNTPEEYVIEQNGKLVRSASFTEEGYLSWT